MRSVPSFDPEFGVAPTADPLSYPGIPPRHSTLLLGNAVLRMHERSRRRLPQWRVEVDERSVPGEQRTVDMLPLNYVLLRHNEIPMGARVPVLARSPRADLLCGKPNYVTCRVQTAALTTIEREVCLVEDLTLSLLGVEPGGEVVIEGWANRHNVVSEVRLKAFQTTDTIQQRRESLHGGDLS